MEARQSQPHGEAPALPRELAVGTRHAGLGRRLLIGVIRAYLGLALRTTRWRFAGDPASAAILTGRTQTNGAVVAFWHASLPLTPALWFQARPQNPDLELYVLISRNADGRLISDIVAHWDIIGIAGSTAKGGKDKGGAQALRRATRILRDGKLVGITPDGPRGPARQAEPGAVVLARLGNRPIVPLGAMMDGWRLPSWDRMILPRPFGRGEFYYGAPLPPDSDTQSLQAAIDSAQDMSEARLAATRARMQDILWRGIGALLSPLLIGLIQTRIAKGREISTRRRERLGFAGMPRPAGRLIWLHAASVGESISLRPLLDALRAQDPATRLLVTTATVTGGEIIDRHAEKHGGGIIHQFIPFDVRRWIDRFLDHWRPEIAILIESEIWPGLFGACRARSIPVGVVNGRMSERSWAKWMKMRMLARRCFGDLTWVAARSDDDASRFAALGTPKVVCFGDLKHAAPPLSADAASLEELRRRLNGRPLWLAAATHPGEEAVIADVAARLHARHPALLTIVVPRHPPRGAEIAALLGGAPRRSQGTWPSAADPFWVADTLGELGLFYRLCRLVFLGNSLHVAPGGGGHNPFEPARLGGAVVTGMRIQNFNQAFEILGDATLACHDDMLFDVISRLLDNPDDVAAMGTRGQARANGASNAVSDLVTLIQTTRKGAWS